MIFIKDSKLKRKIIMERYLNPLHKGVIKDIKPINFYSNFCNDKLNLYIEIKNQKINQVKFEGDGCAIFLSSTDLMIDNIIGKNLKKIDEILKNYDLLINQKKQYNQKILGELVIFNNLKNHPNRLYCAQIIYFALKKYLENSRFY